MNVSQYEGEVDTNLKVYCIIEDFHRYWSGKNIQLIEHMLTFL